MGSPCRGGIVTVSDNTQNIMPGFRMLAFKCMKEGVHYLKVAFFFKILFLKVFKLTHSLKNSTKKLCGKFSNKYENKLDRI